MTCDACSDAHHSEDYAPYRIGTKEIGYGVILLKGCRKHIKLAFDRLNSQEWEGE